MLSHLFIDCFLTFSSLPKLKS